jgi:hypothetical protein
VRGVNALMSINIREQLAHLNRLKYTDMSSILGTSHGKRWKLYSIPIQLYHKSWTTIIWCDFKKLYSIEILNVDLI